MKIIPNTKTFQFLLLVISIGSFIFLISLLLILLLYKKRENYTNSPNIRILNLVLFSHSEEYDAMYTLTSPYYKKHNIDTLYYTFSDTTEVVDDILYIKGTETKIPGILDKTIKAFEYIQPYLDEYDYVVRSNISTIINFDLLKKQLMNKPIDYGGGIMWDLQWLHPESGIIDKTHWNKKFASGTSIILSSKLVKRILENKQHIQYNLIDDVAIGVLIHDYFSDIMPVDFSKYFIALDNHNGHEPSIKSQISNMTHIFYRNRSSDTRNVDVIQMKVILDVI